MMDNERYEKRYNEVRKKCLLRQERIDSKKDKYEACILKGEHYLCLHDEYDTCPLFVFIEKTIWTKNPT